MVFWKLILWEKEKRESSKQAKNILLQQPSYIHFVNFEIWVCGEEKRKEEKNKTDVKLETIDKLVAAVHKKNVMHFFHLIFSKLSFAQRK